MTGIKKFVYYLTGFVAVGTLIQLPFAFALSSVLSNPKTIDTALKDSGAYERFVPLALENLAASAKDPNAQKLLNDNAVREAIASSIKTSDVEASGQSIINGVYAWLEGKTKLPKFTIDLSRSRDDLVKNLSAVAENRAAGLPTCTLAQLQTFNLNEDILSIPCLPPGVNPAQIGQQFSDQAMQQVDFLKNPVITDETLLKATDTAQAEKDAESAPRLYQSLHDSKWVTLAMLVVLLSLLIFARKDRLAGIRFSAKLTLGVGVFLGIIVVMFWAASSQEAAKSAPNEAGVIATKALILIIRKVNDVVQWFALGYLILGGVTLLYLRKRAPNTPIEPKPADPVTTV